MKKTVFVLFAFFCYVSVNAQIAIDTVPNVYGTKRGVILGSSGVVAYPDSATVYQAKFRSDTARNNIYTSIKRNTDSITAKSTYSKGLTVYGNSISEGTGATFITNAFAFILGRQIGGQFLNYGKSSDQVADLTYRWQFPTSNPIGNGADPLTVIEIGTNDVTRYTTNTNQQTIFQRGIMASLSWAAIPAASKKMGQIFTLSGFAVTDTIQQGVGIKSLTNGNTATTTITTLATSYIYVWYLIRDNNLGSFTFSIDGTLQTDNYNGTTTIYNYGDNGATIATQNGYTSGIACNRFAVIGANSHTVVITNNSTTGQNVTILGIGTNPATSTLNPTVIYVTPNQQNNANNALSATYSGFATTIASTLQGDRLNILVADTRTALGNNFATYYSDVIHPNNAGHAKMDSVIIATIPSLNVGSSIPNPYVPQSVYQYTQPVNPSQFFSPNAGNLNSSITYNPGTKWIGLGGNYVFTNWQNGYGVMTLAPNTGSAPLASWGIYPTVSSGYPSGILPTTSSHIYFQIASDGRVMMYPNGSGNSNVAYFANNYVSFGPFAAVGGNTFTTSFPNNYVMTSTAATSGANASSAYLGWGCNKWNGSVSVRDDAGFRYIPQSGTNSNGYLTLQRGNNVGSSLFAMDLSTATLPNILGKATITGVIDNSAAASGIVGENIESEINTATNYTTTATYQPVTSITLTAGDWDLSTIGTFNTNTATITAAANAIFVVSTTTASATGATAKNTMYIPQAALLGTSTQSSASANYRVSIASTTTYYLNTQATFTLGNPQFTGFIRARRMR